MEFVRRADVQTETIERYVREGLRQAILQGQSKGCFYELAVL